MVGVTLDSVFTTTPIVKTAVNNSNLVESDLAGTEIKVDSKIMSAKDFCADFNSGKLNNKKIEIKKGTTTYEFRFETSEGSDKLYFVPTGQTPIAAALGTNSPTIPAPSTQDPPAPPATSGIAAGIIYPIDCKEGLPKMLLARLQQKGIEFKNGEISFNELLTSSDPEVVATGKALIYSLAFKGEGISKENYDKLKDLKPPLISGDISYEDLAKKWGTDAMALSKAGVIPPENKDAFILGIADKLSGGTITYATSKGEPTAIVSYAKMADGKYVATYKLPNGNPEVVTDESGNPKTFEKEDDIKPFVDKWIKTKHEDDKIDTGIFGINKMDGKTIVEKGSAAKMEELMAKLKPIFELVKQITDLILAMKYRTSAQAILASHGQLTAF